MIQRCSLLPVLLLAGSICAFGQLLDPATLHVGTGVGTGCVTGCPGVVSGEVTATSTSFDVFQESGSQSKLLGSEILLIAAVPNTATGTVTTSSVLKATEYDPYTTVNPLNIHTETIAAGQTPNQYGNVNPTLLNETTLTTGQDVFTALGPSISGANNSESFGNFNSAYAAEEAVSTPGFSGTPTSYQVYVFSISTTAFNGNSALDFKSSLPVGTFIMAFGEDATCAATGCDNGKIFSTQFTNTGLIVQSTTSPQTSPQTSPTPEPNSLMLLGSALLGTCAWLRKKLVRS